jgi:hypothetical protein
MRKLAVWQPNHAVNDHGPRFPRDYLVRLNTLVRAGACGDAVEYL